MSVTSSSPWGTIDYPGSSGYVTGDQFQNIYGIYWDPTTRQVRSADPRIAGYDTAGRLKYAPSPTGATGASGTVNPYASLLNTSGSAAAPGASGIRPSLTGSPAVGGTGYNPSAAPGAGYNPFFTVANTKSPEIAAQIQKLLGQYNNLGALDPTKEISDAMAASNGDYQRYLSQDTGAVDKWFNGDVEKALATLRAERGQAYKGATGQALNNLSRILSLDQMGQGGAGTVGTSSYTQKQGLDTAAQLAVQEALDAATQGRTDLMTVLGGQQQNLGTRANLTTQDITRRLLPSQTGANWFQTLIQGLAPIAQLQLANTFYGLGGEQGASTIPAVNGGGGYGYAPSPATRYSVANSVPIPAMSYSRSGGYSGSPIAPQTSALDTLRNQILAGNYSGWQDLINNSQVGYPGTVADANSSYF